MQSPSGPINVVTYISKSGDGSAVILGYSEFSGKITDPAATLSSGRDSLLKSLGATANGERDVKVSGHPARTFNYSATSPRVVFIERTRDNTGLVLNLALNYGGRTEILQAVKRIAAKVHAGEITPDQIDESLVQAVPRSRPLREAAQAIPVQVRRPQARDGGHLVAGLCGCPSPHSRATRPAMARQWLPCQ